MGTVWAAVSMNLMFSGGLLLTIEVVMVHCDPFLPEKSMSDTLRHSFFFAISRVTWHTSVVLTCNATLTNSHRTAIRWLFFYVLSQFNHPLSFKFALGDYFF